MRRYRAAVILAAAAAGGASYLLVIRPRDEADHLNTTMRTLGLYLLLFAYVNYRWAVGQPFSFPSIFPDGVAFTLGGNGITWTTVGTIVVAGLLSAFFAWFFRRTRLGLLFLGMASRPEIAELLGVATRRLTLLAWMAAAMVSLVVALLIAPVALLTTDMMDPFLLLAFTAAIVGGLTSMVGVFLGGLVIGVMDNLVTVYWNGDSAMLAVFGLLILVLLVKPEGLLGTRSAERV
jgi:branched-chain amino acid transport system permease protein